MSRFELMPLILFALALVVITEAGASAKGCCLAAGTRISTMRNDGSYTTLPIERIRIGDTVLSYCVEQGEVISSRVIGISAGFAWHVNRITVTTESGVSLIVSITDEHPLLGEGRCWMKAGDLNVGDHLISLDGKLRVSSIKRSVGFFPVFNLAVENGNYVISTESGVTIIARDSQR